MEIALKHIEQAAAAILFCSAILILLSGTRGIRMLTTQVQQAVSRRDIVYEQDNAYEELITYKEIISMLMGELFYDVQIGKYSIDCEGYSMDQINLQIIENRNYKRNYMYDAVGNIIKVIYS